LIKYIKSVLWRVAKCLSYIEETQCLKVNYLIMGADSKHYYLVLCADSTINYLVMCADSRSQHEVKYPPLIGSSHRTGDYVICNIHDTCHQQDILAFNPLAGTI
jgi:hypothetical protein